ncbi:MAG TPA: phenylalanine--tRNA ligase subunit beta [Acidimicrobiia bacterium]|nr:phenylalanine--tRNA ligase subunit beta [Acidimicrobiia bacterium]
MKVSLHWLAEFIDLPDPDPNEVQRALNSLGLKVESVTELEADWSGVYVGVVESIRPHPNADKVRLCLVSTGKEPIEVVCGAWNFDEGAKVAFAVPGATLAGGFELGARTIRGIESRGMICSERELGLGADHEGILVLDPDTELGRPFEEVVHLPDYVLDLEITSNRPDQMSMLGVARELAAFYGVPYRLPPAEVAGTDEALRTIVSVDDPDGCYRFVARELFGVEVKPSPLRIRQRLKAAGIRPISNIVDVTNYVMLELGQPLHAFDFDRLAKNEIVVRRAQAGERLRTLDGVDRTLTEADLVVADAETATGLAGTMGGGDSEVTPETKNVVIEAASWDAPTVLHMSKRHAIRTEASARFERGVDPNLPPLAAARANRLMMELAGGTSPSEAIDVVTRAFVPATVSLSLAEVDRLLGGVVPRAEVSRLLERLDLEVEGDDPLVVTIPTRRRDLERPADLVEEVARLYGYDSFPESIPTGPAGGYNDEQHRHQSLRRVLTGAGLYQAINLSFSGTEDLAAFAYPADHQARLTVRVSNPLNEELATLRTSLLPGLLRTLRYNLNRGSGDLGIFETGRVFIHMPWEEDDRLPYQPERLGFAVSGHLGPSEMGNGARPVDLFTATALWRILATGLGLDDWRLESAAPAGYHPGRAARVLLGGREIGYVGELHPSTAAAYDLEGRIAVGEVELAPLLAPVRRWELVEPSSFPSIDFDLSFVVPEEMPAEDLLTTTRDVASDLCERAQLFDEYQGTELGGGKKALAITYRFRAPDHTFSSDEIADLRQRLVAAARALGATLRGEKA